MQVGVWKVGSLYLKKSHGCYFVKVTAPNGKREDRRLDPDKKKADGLRCNLVAQLEKEGAPTPDYLVQDLVDLFLDHVKANNAPKTYRWHRDFLKTFCQSIPPRLKVKDLKLAHA
jgi:hypothetical protein